MTPVEQQLAIEQVPELDELLDVFGGDETPPEELDLELTVRHLTIRLRQVEERREETKRLMGRVVGPYQATLRDCDEKEERIRNHVKDILGRLGRKVTWPDLGTWQLRKTPVRYRVVDQEAVERAYAAAQVSLPVVVDWSAVGKTLEARFKETGEVHPGCEVQPAGQTVAFSK